MIVIAYKVLNTDQTPYHGGNGEWVKKRWRTVTGPLNPCRNGIHYCRPDQLVQWLGPAIWVFEDGSPDETVDAGDKMVTRRGRILERVEAWNETTARLFAADCAEAVLPIFEQECPGDDRPRKAIDAARLYARGELSDEDRAAAGAAAEDAAGAAVRSEQTVILLDYLEGRRT